MGADVDGTVRPLRQIALAEVCRHYDQLHFWPFSPFCAVRSPPVPPSRQAGLIVSSVIRLPSPTAQHEYTIGIR